MISKQIDVEEYIANKEEETRNRLENFLEEECASLCMDDEEDRKELARLLQEADWI